MQESKPILEKPLNNVAENLHLFPESSNIELLETSALSESSLRKDWLSRLEDEAWQDL